MMDKWVFVYRIVYPGFRLKFLVLASWTEASPHPERAWVSQSRAGSRRLTIAE
jgi:hypothetical protein